MKIDEKAFDIALEPATNELFAEPPSFRAMMRKRFEMYEAAKAEQPVGLSAIEELQSYSKSADANPELYRDGWECAIQCAINVLRRHQEQAPVRESGSGE